MAQLLSQTLSQQMRMEQRLTPQLIQSMTLLQKPVADLEAYINEALETNAALEVAEPEAEDAAEKEDRAAPEGRDDPEHREGVSFNRLDRFSRVYEVDWDGRSPHPARRLGERGAPDAKMAALANTAGREIGLQEHLLSQWALLDLDDEVRRGGEAIINNLDPDGYLRVRLEQIAESVRPPLTLDTLQQALKEVQELEPAGVAARDLVECLLLQLERLPGDNQMERVLIQKHLHDLIHNRLPEVSRATGYSIGEINEAIKVMRSNLCLHPGYLVGDRAVPPIRPDVIVEYAETGGGLTVCLTRGNTPKLCIRKDVAAMARSKKNGQDMRDFARKQVMEATPLLHALRFRQNRLLEVAEAIIEKQRDFFDIGPEGLKVLRMTEVAEDLQCDSSTISRTVADKYMQTPRGIYPLRYFFTGGTQTDEGESVGWNRVKARVRELVETEDRKTPLKDDEIVAALQQEGIEISRRTIAKYRKQMGIPTAQQRREY